MAKTKTSLVVLYNHYFPENVDRINAIYSDRFSEILHLLPLALEENLSVISVSRSSHHFQGYIFDAREALARGDCDRFLFLADDVFLNPLIESDTIDEYFGLTNSNDAFLAGLRSFRELKSFWRHTASAQSFALASQALDIRHALPSYEEALSRLQLHGVASVRIRRKALYPSVAAYLYSKSTEIIRKADGLIRRALRILGKDQWRHSSRIRLKYPLAWGYSDVFILPKSKLTDFSRFCGAFSAAGLFVEIALPTALALSCESLKTRAASNLHGHSLWGATRNQLDKYDKSLSKLASEFPDDWLFLHPVKLSEWNA